MLVQNGKFIELEDGQITICPDIEIKFWYATCPSSNCQTTTSYLLVLCSDFGLAELFHIDSRNTRNGYLSNKYCGKTNYKAPEVE